MDRHEDLKRLLLPLRDDAVAAVCPPPDHSQAVEMNRGGPASTRDVPQSDALSSPETLDRSRLETFAEQAKEEIEIPHTVQERHDDHGIELLEMSEGSGPQERELRERELREREQRERELQEQEQREQSPPNAQGFWSWFWSWKHFRSFCKAQFCCCYYCCCCCCYE